MPDRRIAEHYADAGFCARLDATLTAAGLDRPGVAPEDLSLFDQFHTRGRPATLELAVAAGLDGKTRVLDIGSGIGGPARTLAAEFGCAVTGLDLVADYCRAAARLTRLTGLDDRARFVCGSALAAPFADGSFDLIWTQHAAMNIPDKRALYQECARLLVPCGRIALNDIVAGAAGPPYFPQPWARDPGTSFLESAGELRGWLAVAGFHIVAWEDKTAEVADWTRNVMAKRAAADSAGAQGQARGGAALGVHLLLGPGFPEMAANLARSLEEGRLAVVVAVAERM